MHMEKEKTNYLIMFVKKKRLSDNDTILQLIGIAFCNKSIGTEVEMAQTAFLAGVIQ